MNRLFSLLFLLSANVWAAQIDGPPLPRKNVISNSGQPVTLNSEQKQWLDQNFRRIDKLKKDSAAAEIRRNFPAMPESSIEFLISQASRLQQEDNRKQLDLLKRSLDQQKMQKQALLKKIRDMEDLLAKTTDPGKRKNIANEINELKRKQAQLENNIRATEQSIRQIQSNS